MKEISAKEFGKLQSDVEYLTKTSDTHTKMLERMETKLDGLVTQEQLKQAVEPLHTQVNDHEARLAAVEQRNILADASVWKKIGIAFESNFIKFVGIGLFVFALFVAYLFMRQELLNTLPDELNSVIQRQK